MPQTRPTKLDPPVDPARDHLLGDENAELALVEYGNYTRDSCHAAHEVVAGLRDRFGSRMRYVFRHLEEIAREFNLPSRDGEHAAAYETARRRVQEDRQSAKRSGVIVTPTFFINGRRYEGPWDENTLAMHGPFSKVGKNPPHSLVKERRRFHRIFHGE